MENIEPKQQNKVGSPVIFMKIFLQFFFKTKDYMEKYNDILSYHCKEQQSKKQYHDMVMVNIMTFLALHAFSSVKLPKEKYGVVQKFSNTQKSVHNKVSNG